MKGIAKRSLEFSLLSSLWLGCGYTVLAQNTCEDRALTLQVLGSGGPELQDQRASSSYLIWRDNRAAVVVDTGGGSALRFGQSGAEVKTLDAIALTHLHADHTADLPALVKSSWFEGRQKDLPVFGPEGNQLMPSVDGFLSKLFGIEQGAFRYLSDFVDQKPAGHYKLKPVVVSAKKPTVVHDEDDLRLTGVAVNHGPIPAVAWRVEVNSKSVVFSGDMSAKTAGVLGELAQKADVLVAHNAVPEGAGARALSLHMPPSVIGEIAQEADVAKLVLSHRMLRTLGREQDTLNAIRKSFKGSVVFADDLDCFVIH